MKRFHIVLVVVAVLIATVPAAQAGNWGAAKTDAPPYVLCTEGTNTSECTPNDDVHTVYISTSWPITDGNIKSALLDSLANDYDALPQISATQVFTNDADVQILFLTVNPNWDFAYTTCAYGATTGYDNIRYYMWCRPQRLYLQDFPGAYEQCWDSAPCRAHYTCHELGHTLGLQHHFKDHNSCMSYWDDPHPTNLDDHDKDHLFDCFPRPALPLPTYPAESRTSLCENFE